MGCATVTAQAVMTAGRAGGAATARRSNEEAFTNSATCLRSWRRCRARRAPPPHPGPTVSISTDTSFAVSRHQLSPSDDYKLFAYYRVENAVPAFHFISAPASLPSVVEYRDGGTIKRVGLDSLLRSTGTHAFIVATDDKVVYEAYFNGYQRDSVNISRSMAKSFTSALVGIAIGEGSIKSINDPIVNYLLELKGRGFGPNPFRLTVLGLVSSLVCQKSDRAHAQVSSALRYDHPP
jgi:hypothetical protein